eukprot:TRINITY_DN16764_c0_g1_i1.p1 TRINITY_DN16764_c0_g1~~TRINITY_DN16764_c0_g1_i1.p1  ORF type:complete len:260 (+),score=31.47 TRINITY_DN16764_c0_g1_i1:1-780(+)
MQNYSQSIDEILALREENVRLQEDVEQYIEDLENAEEVIQDLRNEISEFKMQLDLQNANMKIKSQEINTVENEKDLITHELQRELQSMQEAHEQEISDLQSLNQSLQQKIKSYEYYTLYYKEIEQDNFKLKAELEALKSKEQVNGKSENKEVEESSQLAEKISQLEQKIKEQESQYLQLEQEYIQYKMGVAMADLKNENLLDKLRKLEKALKLREEQLKQFKSQRENLLADMTTFVNTLSDSMHEEKKLKEKILSLIHI